MSDQPSALQELADVPKEFFKDGTQFINRCTKRESILVNTESPFHMLEHDAAVVEALAQLQRVRKTVCDRDCSGTAMCHMRASTVAAVFSWQSLHVFRSTAAATASCSQLMRQSRNHSSTISSSEPFI
jgi:hypothetical protein